MYMYYAYTVYHNVKSIQCSWLIYHKDAKDNHLTNLFSNRWPGQEACGDFCTIPLSLQYNKLQSSLLVFLLHV